MPGEQWGEQDQSFINDAMRDVNVPYGERVYLKQYTGIAIPGDPLNGIQAVYSYKITPVQAVVDSVSATDVLYSGGIYQIGDLRVTLTQKLNFVDSTIQTGGISQGDRLQYREHDYRIVGRMNPETLILQDKVFVYVFRKVGNV
jgi:hypothetical protein